MKKFPVLISIPHGGLDAPIEFKNIIGINRSDLFNDIDPFTYEIFNIGSMAKRVISTTVARTFIDLNRAPDDLPPQNPDGIIKSMTCYKKQIYKIGKEPNETLRKRVIEKYYAPYHKEIKEVGNQERDIQLALDCHSMAEKPPDIAPDGDQFKKIKRPVICLGNNHGKSCSWEMVEKMSRCFCKAFSLKKGDVTINQPFAGGFITRTYGGNPMPWIQVEFNRSLYLSPPWFNPITQEMNKRRLKELKDLFIKVLDLFFGSN